MKLETQANELVIKALTGDRDALSNLIKGVNDYIFSLSLRMLGSVPNAEDATQEILIKIITNLSTFKMNAKFETWVYRIATNYLIDYKKTLFAQYPLSFEYYEQDLHGTVVDIDDTIQKHEQKSLVKELKLSCTNVMLQCFSPSERCVFILGTMFRLNSKVAGDVMGITAENYRKKLSRSKDKMRTFLSNNCELAGGLCHCANRTNYAVKHGRLSSANLEYSQLKPINTKIINACIADMEDIEEQSDIFKNLPLYHSTINSTEFLVQLLQSETMKQLIEFKMEDFSC